MLITADNTIIKIFLFIKVFLVMVYTKGISKPIRPRGNTFIIKYIER